MADDDFRYVCSVCGEEFACERPYVEGINAAAQGDAKKRGVDIRLAAVLCSDCGNRLLAQWRAERKYGEN